jgi:ligand-binding SRPBCC domain-containing protein
VARKVVEFKQVMPGTVEQMWAFHAHPKAFLRLTPPPIFIQVHRNSIANLTGGDVEFTMWLGPIPLRWHAQHKPGPTPTSFVDHQLSGPMAYWEHMHTFKTVPGGVELTDHITLDHKPGVAGIFSRLMFDGLPLRIFFFYRHLRTKMGLASAEVSQYPLPTAH